MSWRDAVARLRGAPAERTTGRPTSSNGASSLHLEWLWDGPPPVLVEVAATLTVTRPPVVDELHFWALQASFVDRWGGRAGGGHVGLQHHPRHPGGAVNWGGYGRDGRELAGSASPLPSATGNPNTRDLAWEPSRPHRLRIRQGAAGWAGVVDDVGIRELHVGGDRLASILVWSEVFAPCEAASAVRWSDLSGTTADGATVRPRAVRTRYQAVADGGCSNTSSDPDGRGGVVQRTAVPRTAPAGRVIPLP